MPTAIPMINFHLWRIKGFGAGSVDIMIDCEVDVVELVLKGDKVTMEIVVELVIVDIYSYWHQKKQ